MKIVTTESFIERSRKIHNDFYDYSKTIYKSTLENVTIVCPIHGDFSQRPNDHLMGKGCPSCKESKGERIIAEWLDERKIKYEQQKIFYDCRNINPLRFDFYLLEMNTVIEFDGEQHFRSVIWGSRSKEEAERDFMIGQENDSIKNEYTKQKGIVLKRIKYSDDIKNILENWDN